MTLREAARALRERQVSAVELTRDALARIEDLNPGLNGFITVTAGSALRRAAAADGELASGRDLGPLHGIPIALKDLFCTRGVRTTCGSRVFENYVPDFDAAVVERLESGGAVLTGKLNMHELAYGVTSTVSHFGPVRNPWNAEHVPGGSSGGSGAAVAAGMVFAAMGSDTGGSIRIPASFCGVVGLKPTYGRVSRYGALPLAFSLDHMGPLTRDVRDAALVLSAIAGHDPRDASSSRRPVASYLPEDGCSIRGVRIGFSENFFWERLDPEVEAATRGALAQAESLGAILQPVALPDIPALIAVGQAIQLPEAAAALETHLGHRDWFSPSVLSLLDAGRLLPATDYIQAQRLRRKMQQEFGRIWEQVDCLVAPTTPVPAPRVGDTVVRIRGVEEDLRTAVTRLVRPFNILGWPVVSLPCGWTRQALPIGLQVIGRPFDEALILRVAATLEDLIGRPSCIRDNPIL